MIAYYLGRTAQALLISLPIAAGGCTNGSLAVDADRGGGHGHFEQVELTLAGTDEVLARWSFEEGWRDASGETLDRLPPAVLSDDGLRPLQAGGEPASLEVHFHSQAPLVIAPLDEAGADAGIGNPCGEFSARYFPLDDTTSTLAWPNLPHPQQPEGPALFAERAGGELVQVFHCDRVDIYPEQAGIANLEIILWHVNHADQASTALKVEIQE